MVSDDDVPPEAEDEIPNLTDREDPEGEEPEDCSDDDGSSSSSSSSSSSEDDGLFASRYPTSQRIKIENISAKYF